MFGEEIRWVARSFRGETGQIRPDLVGWDVNGNLVIVEVKPLDPKPGRNQYNKPRQAIGQVIHKVIQS